MTGRLDTKKWVGFASAVFAGIVANYIFKWLPNIDPIDPAITFISNGISFLGQNSNIPNWLILFLGLCFALLMILLFIVVVISRDTKSGSSHFVEYVRDFVYEIEWHWQWVGNNIDWDSLTPLCPRCSYQLVSYNASAFNAIERIAMVCEDCSYRKEFNFGHRDLFRRVEMKIEKNIRTREYENILKAR